MGPIPSPTLHGQCSSTPPSTLLSHACDHHTLPSIPPQGRPPLLIYHKPCEAYWLNAGLVPSPQLRQAFWLLGWVAGQAPANRAVLGVPLAPLLWHKLLGGNEFEVRGRGGGRWLAEREGLGGWCGLMCTE
jgi:hypothetical protein